MNVSDPVILLLVESDSLDIVKYAEQVGLDGVRVGGLPEDLEEGRVRHEEEAREDEPLLLEVSRERLLAELELLEEVGQQLAQRLVPHAALDNVGHLVGLGHDLHPRLVDVLETFCLLESRGEREECE